MHYNISRHIDSVLGALICLELSDNGSYATPFFVQQAALKEARIWRETYCGIIRFFVNQQVLNVAGLEQWQQEEYRNLPKCHQCGVPLTNIVIPTSTGQGFFCSEKCVNINYWEATEQFQDQHDVDYL